MCRPPATCWVAPLSSLRCFGAVLFQLLSACGTPQGNVLGQLSGLIPSKARHCCVCEPLAYQCLHPPDSDKAVFTRASREGKNKRLVSLVRRLGREEQETHSMRALTSPLWIRSLSSSQMEGHEAACVLGHNVEFAAFNTPRGWGEAWFGEEKARNLSNPSQPAALVPQDNRSEAGLPQASVSSLPSPFWTCHTHISCPQASALLEPSPREPYKLGNDLVWSLKCLDGVKLTILYFSSNPL